MRTIELSYPHRFIHEELPETAAAIGFFDGIHKGHQKVISEAVREAKQRKLESAVITFHPHPSEVLNAMTKNIQYITPLREKQEILQRMDVDRLYIIKFDKELAALSPEEFIDHFIIGLNVCHLVSGFDFTFGAKGSGNADNMAAFANGRFTYEAVRKVELAGEKISSTKIRKLLAAGKVDQAAELLGRPLAVTGKVIHGSKRGRQIGYPTANLEINKEALLPKIGVYAVKAVYKQQAYEAMASLGLNPTFSYDDPGLKLEVHLFDYENDLYGEDLIVEWHQFIRNEEKFAGIEPLMKQIQEDERTIRAYFKG